jgi:hypothetical protein
MSLDEKEDNTYLLDAESPIDFRGMWHYLSVWGSK